MVLGSLKEGPAGFREISRAAPGISDSALMPALAQISLWARGAPAGGGLSGRQRMSMTGLVPARVPWSRRRARASATAADAAERLRRAPVAEAPVRLRAPVPADLALDLHPAAAQAVHTHDEPPAVAQQGEERQADPDRPRAAARRRLLEGPADHVGRERVAAVVADAEQL